jgi:hypothetical protein
VNEGHIQPRRGLSKRCSAITVDPKSQIGLGLSFVDLRIRSGIDDRARRMRFNDFLDRSRIGYFELGAAYRNEWQFFLIGQGYQSARELTGLARDENRTWFLHR